MSQVAFEYAEVNNKSNLSNNSKVFGSRSSIIKLWDKECLQNDKLLTLPVVALSC